MSSTLMFFISLMLFTATLSLGGCIKSERAALLQFKNGLSDPSNRLSDWVSDRSDCCRWSGVVCHNMTAHVLELHLRTLCRQEYYGPDRYLTRFLYDDSEYDEYHQKSAFGGKSLRYLNLCGAGFGGMIPPQLGNLTNLHYLNLGSAYEYDLHVENLDWISSFSFLEFLDMSTVDLSQSFDWLKVSNSLPSLLELHLSSCRLANLLPSLNSSSLFILDLSNNYFRGPIPNGLQNMTSSFLRELDLSYNDFNSSIPNWLYDLTHLQLLNLKFNELQGQISSGITNLTSLITLDMSNNFDLEFENGIPKSFKHFCNLRSLDLSGVELNQEINDVLAIMSSRSCVSNVLQSLSLFSCELSGHFTDDLSYFKNLVNLDISDNLISGPIPLSFSEMNSLQYVNLSSNKLKGEVSHLHFANLTRLFVFYASGNNISLRVSSNWIPPLQLHSLDLGSWHIGPQFPKWLRLLKHLTILDLSNARISSLVPVWFWDSLSNYYYLDLSHNQMHGSIPNIPFVGGFVLKFLLNSNNFSGTVPYFSSDITELDLSNNSFSGSIFHFLCNNMNEEKQMGYLNLERNFLHGEIPDCWRSWKYLARLVLSNNKFSGNIPSSIGTLSALQSLHLHNNNLSGEIPSAIQNCKKLLILDLSENHLVGNIPTWIGDTFGGMFILNLRANKFDGYLPEELCHLVSLHILDLAHNSFSGTIPSCFSNFTGMVTRNDSDGSFYAIANSSKYTGLSFMESTLLVIKGDMMEYSTILRLVRSIDLSDNNLSGEIPMEITGLEGLVSLNLSQNALTWRIPESIGDMRWLEVIDFSQNQLSGQIPESMSRLNSLSSLNLSYNNLSGKIPLGNQLQSLNQSSFTGNQLCGVPLVKSCSLDDAQPGTDNENEEGNDVEVD